MTPTPPGPRQRKAPRRKLRPSESSSPVPAPADASARRPNPPPRAVEAPSLPTTPPVTDKPVVASIPAFTPTTPESAPSETPVAASTERHVEDKTGEPPKQVLTQTPSDAGKAAAGSETTPTAPATPRQVESAPAPLVSMAAALDAVEVKLATVESQPTAPAVKQAEPATAKIPEAPPAPPTPAPGSDTKIAASLLTQQPFMPAKPDQPEPFGGAASVLMRKPRAYAEVYNDLSESVVNVFRVLRDPASASELKRRVELTPYARAEFEESEWAEVEDVDDPVERARRTVFRACAAFGSTGVSSSRKTGFRSDTSREGVIPAHDWVNWAKEIDAFTQRLQGVVIERRHALEVIQAHDSIQTLHYVDPPYVHATRTRRASRDYAYEMTDGDHEAIAEALHGARGMVVVSGYQSDLYERVYKGWVQKFHVAATVRGAKRTECLWLNRAAAQHSPQRRLDWDIECTI